MLCSPFPPQMRHRRTASPRQVSQASAARSRPAWVEARGCCHLLRARRMRRGSGASVQRADCYKFQRAMRSQRTMRVRSQRQGNEGEAARPAMGSKWCRAHALRGHCGRHAARSTQHALAPATSAPSRCEKETAASLRCGLRSGAWLWTLGADAAHDLVEARRRRPGRVPDLHRACPQGAPGDPR